MMKFYSDDLDIANLQLIQWNQEKLPMNGDFFCRLLEIIL